MAKIRIYELARELNMTNKMLLEKLKEMDITVSSHMSSIDSELINTVKVRILGKEVEEMEVIRVKSTVIRRRRKKAVTQPIQPEERMKPELIEEEKEPKSPVAEEERESEKPDTKEFHGEDKPVEIVSEMIKPDIMKEKEASEEPSVKKAEPQLEIVKPKKIKKRKLKEKPAKIIQLPSVDKEKEPKAKAVSAKKASVEKPKKKTAKVSRAPKEVLELKRPTEEALDKKSKKVKKKGDGDFKDRKFFKKKISFRRKEVVEGADLYSKRQRTRKGRKGVKGKSLVKGQKTQLTTPKAIKRRIKIDDTIILADLARRMGIKAAELIKTFMSLDVMATVNQTVDFETASLVASEFEYELEKATFEEETIIQTEADDPGKLVSRPPVVTIMGHVDHGKTSLLDKIRETRVTEIEAGGITQHIGAYNVITNKGQIVFLDTPGHEAFTAMRARGAKVTDLVVLVVAADDGVMPQTIEAVNHSKAANVPIITAINKIDKDNADIDRVKRELSEIGLTPEDWGGDTIFLEVSAKLNQGIDDLLEMILLQAEVLELKANPDKLARGNVIEAKLDSGKGPVATVLIQEGTLHTGESIVCGIHHGRIRAMLDDRGKQMKTAGPSIPVEVIGLSGVPMAGDELIALEYGKSAKQVSDYRSQKQRSNELAKTSRLSLEKLYEKMQEGEVKDLNMIVKADVHGSIEALRDSLTKLSNDEVKINVVHSATGAIIESDVSLAAVSNAIIIGFNVRSTGKVVELAHEEHVDIRYYDIIYNVIKDIKDAILGMMSSTFEERLLGRADIREVFHIPKVGAVAGCYVTDGKIERGKPVRLIRDGVVYHKGKIASLRRFKDDAKEVQIGYECGIGIQNYNDIKVGDTIECYYLEEIKPKID